MIRAVIIDDEIHSLKTINWKLEKFCPGVEVLGSFNDPEKGLEFLSQNETDLLFLDVEMPKLNGFEVLSELGDINFEVIFITAYNEFALRAIKFNALDYLLKPVEKDELIKAVDKVNSKHPNWVSQDQLNNLLDNFEKGSLTDSRIALSTQESIEYVLPTDIIYCKSESNYTQIHLEDGRMKMISRTLKEFEDLLKDHKFSRPHHSYLVNILFITKYMRSDGGYLVMKDGTNVPLSRNRKDEFLKLL